MRANATKYQNELKKNLFCSAKVKKQLLNSFQCSLDAFLEENPTPSMADLHDAFGPPAEMARILSKQITEQEIKKFKRQSTAIQVIAILLALVLVLLTFYVFFWKEKPFTYNDSQLAVSKMLLYPITEENPKDTQQSVLHLLMRIPLPLDGNNKKQQKSEILILGETAPEITSPCIHLTATQTRTIKSIGIPVATITLEATFAYDGASVSVVSARVIQADTYMGWVLTENALNSSGGTASLDASLSKQFVLDAPFTMTISCDKSGNLI